MFRAHLTARVTRQSRIGGCRFFSATPVTSSSFPGAEKPKIVAPSEVEAKAVSTALGQLLDGSGGGRWALTTAGDGIERSFKFKTFTKTWVRMPGPNWTISGCG